MHPAFPRNQRKEHLAFESYRLADFSVEQHVYALPSHAAQTSTAASAGYKELKARSLLRALALAPETEGVPLCAYVDQGGYVTFVEVLTPPRFTRAYRVANDAPCTLVCLDRTSWLVCDGASIHNVHRAPSGEVERKWIHFIPELKATDPLAWSVLNAAVRDGALHILVQRPFRTTQVAPAHAGLGASGVEGSCGKQSHTLFQVALLHSTPEALHTIWHVVGEEPVRIADLQTTTRLGAETPFADEMPLRPRILRSIDDSPDVPYSWTQTDDTVTVAFALPPTIAKQAICVHFSHKGLSVQLTRTDERATDAGSDKLGIAAVLCTDAFQSRALWGEINVAESVWTWEHTQTRTTGLLLLHMAKAHASTRWPYVFVGGIGDDVAETMDAAQLDTAQQGLEKYTSEVQPPSISSVLRDELEEEDALVGATLSFTYVALDGTVSYTKCEPVTLLAICARSTPNVQRVLIKHGVDGLVFCAPNEPKGAWTHTETVSAIGYVLASKRDAHPIYMICTPHAETTTVLAVESRRGGTLGNTVYMYRASDTNSAYGESCIFALGATEHGSTIPTGTALDVVAIDGTHESLIFLCDAALVVVRVAQLSMY